MVRVYWITAKDTGRIVCFRFEENAKAYFERNYKNREDVDRFYIEPVDTPISDFPEWSWYWELNTPEKEYKNSVLCEIDD